MDRELSPVLCDSAEGREWVRDGRCAREGEGVGRGLMLVDDVWQRPTQYCKAVVLQLKNIEKEEWNWRNQPA